MRTTTMPTGQLHVLLWLYLTPAPYPKPSRYHQEFVDELIRLG